MLILLVLFALAGPSISSLSVVGSKFFYPNGTQFFIKGISYQLVPHDPLTDPEQCQRDIDRMAELGANAIRVYHVDSYANHTGCMRALGNAGIYVFVDLDTFHTQIQQDSPHWNDTQFHAFRSVLDEFQQFANTAGVFVGNEVLTTKLGAAAAPYILAAAHDIKMYRDQMKYRPIPVGYSAADIAELRPMLQNYMACSPDPAQRLDFFGLNAYEWCGPSSYVTSGYSELQRNASGYPIPIFFTETGCNVARPRRFTDQAAIFGPFMVDTWSGSIVYEWIQETNDYGLISYGPPDPGALDAVATKPIVYDGFTRKGTPTPIVPDFYNLKKQWATLSPTGVALSDYTRSTTAITVPACPQYTPGGWTVDPSEPLPVLLGRSSVPATTTPTPTKASNGSADVQSSHVGYGGSNVGHSDASLLGISMTMWTVLSGVTAVMTGVVAWWL